jgi:hypothetical protein
VPNAGCPKCLVGPGQHGVGQDRRRVRPDGKTRNARRIERFEHGGHTPDIAPRASQPMKGSLDEVGAHRWVASADVGGDEGAGREGQLLCPPQEGLACRSPRPQRQADRRCAKSRAIGHHLDAEQRFDRRRNRGHDRRVPRFGGMVE